MSLSPREKFAYAAAVFVAMGLFIVIALVEVQARSLAVLFFVWIAVGSLALMQIRCPRCKTPVVYQGELGKISIYAGLVRKHCQNCGEDLTKKG